MVDAQNAVEAVAVVGEGVVVGEGEEVAQVQGVQVGGGGGVDQRVQFLLVGPCD